MNRLPSFPERLSLPGTGPWYVRTYVGGYLISTFLCLNLEIVATRIRLDCGVKISREKRSRITTRIDWRFALQRVSRMQGGSRSGCIGPQPDSLFFGRCGCVVAPEIGISATLFTFFLCWVCGVGVVSHNLTVTMDRNREIAH